MAFCASPIGTGKMLHCFMKSRDKLYDHIADDTFSADEANNNFFDEEA